MANVREVLRLNHELRMSIRQIALATGLSKSSVSNYIHQAEKVALGWPLSEEIDDSKLESLLDAKVVPPPLGKPLPDFSIVHEELSRKGVTLRLLWTEYREQHPEGYSYSQFCEHFSRWAKASKISMRQVHKGGEKMFVDFAGRGIDIQDKKTGKTWTAPMFVATLGASSYVYAQAVRSQGIEDWIMAHVAAFEFIGGVPEVLVPDNLKSAVTVPSRYEPDINRTYQDMARHYGTVVVPARVGKPKDKPKAEVEVKHVTMQITAALRKHTFFDLEEANMAIREKLQELNAKKFQKLDTSRKELYERIDKLALKPLPVARYEYVEWQTKKRVPEDYHLNVKEHYYSVPYQYRGEMVEVSLSSTIIQIFLKGRRIALHKRDDTPGGVTTTNEHRPKEHIAMATWTSAQALARAKSIGPNTSLLIEKVMANSIHEELAKRSSSGILKLEKEFPGRLEAAATRALRLNSCTLTTVRSILKQGLDRLPMEESGPKDQGIIHINLRGAKYYGLGRNEPKKRR